MPFTQKDPDPRLGTYQRQYLIRLPQGYTGKEKASILFYFHGWGSSMYERDFAAMANQQNTIIVNPQGMAENTFIMSSWNCGSAGRSDICRNPTDAIQYTSCKKISKTGTCNCYTCYDDVQFVADLVAYLEGALCIDSNQIYGSGTSNGAIFLYYLAPQLAERGLKARFKAIVPFYGANFQNMDDVPASVAGTSIFSFHGQKDTEVPPRGGRSADGYLYVPEATTMAEYAKASGCSASETSISTPYDKRNNQKCYEHKGCKGARIVRCVYPTFGHAFWTSYSAQLMFYFLKGSGNSTVII